MGETGNGKSALGNTILGYNAFESKTSFKSVTEEVTYDVCEWNGYRIKVVDGPGVEDTRMDTNEATQLILKTMSEAISLSPHGYNAFLLVVKFGGRFTAEDKLIVDTLKKIFGEHFFKKLCIIVMTYGDLFEQQVKADFHEWIKESNHGIFTDLLNECNDRIVLFNNRTQDVEIKKKQLNELFDVIESLKIQNCRYSDEHFNTALETRNVLLVESQKELFEEEIMDETNLILQRLKLILDSIDVQKRIPFLKELYQRAAILHNKIQKSDKETGILAKLVKHVWSKCNTIRDEIQISKHVIKDAARMRKEREEQAAARAEELRRQREEIFKNFYVEGNGNDEVMIQMMQNQLDMINEFNEQWELKENELKAKADAEREIEKRKAQEEVENLHTIKKELSRNAHKKTSRRVFARLTSK